MQYSACRASGLRQKYVLSTIETLPCEGTCQEQCLKIKFFWISNQLLILWTETNDEPNYMSSVEISRHLVLAPLQELSWTGMISS